MEAGYLACITTPRQGNRIPENARIVLDNGVFGKGYPGDRAWEAWLHSRRDLAPRALFAVAPDVVSDAKATHAKGLEFLPVVRDMGFPPAFAAQNGQEAFDPPWDLFDCLFIGGDTTWKLSEHARRLAAEAKARGKWVHMGRVNSWRRWQIADAFGCDSVDGTFLTYGPDVLLPTLLSWTAQSSLFEVTAASSPAGRRPREAAL